MSDIASTNSPNGRNPRFKTTRWSLIAEAAGSGSSRHQALEELCLAYWGPVYAYIRRTGLRPDEAEDATQDFFAELIEHGPLLKTADPSHGKFRSYLLAAVKYRLSNDRRAAATIKRGGTVQILSIDSADAERRYAAEPVDGWSPEAIFHRRWALTVLERVLDELQQSYLAAGRDTWFLALKPFLSTHETPAYDELAQELSVSSSAVRVAVHRLRRQYADALTAEIRTTLGDGQSVADEQAELLRALSGGT